MSKIKIFGIPASRAFRALWMAEECGVAYENLRIGFADGSSRTPEYLAVNPNGRIPALQDGDFTMFESLAIDWYLARKYGADKGVGPRTPEEEGHALQWTLWAANEVELPVIEWAFNAIVYPPEKRSATIAAAAWAKIQAPLGVLERALARREYLVGNRFTVADLNVAACLYRLLSVELPDFPRIDTWLDRCFTRPAALAARRLRE